MDLTETELAQLRESLQECLGIANEYRHAIGDEDSILLMQDLRRIARILAIENPEPARRPRTEP